MKRFSKRLIAFSLIVSLLFSTVVGCTERAKNNSSETNVSYFSATPTQQADGPTPTQLPTDAITPSVAGNLNEYLLLKKEMFANNPAVFVQTLLEEELEQRYECFDAVVELEDGTCVPGIAYTDYGSYFETEDESKGFFPAGFLSYGEFSSQTSSSQALEISSLEYTNEKYGFVFAYEPTAFQGHCVINGQYVTYDVDPNGIVSFDSIAFSREICDESRGALFSYDEGRYLYNPNLGQFVGLTGQTLSESFDFSEIEKEVNRILEEQDKNFVQVDCDTCFAIAQETVTSYLLSLQQETFLGYDVEELVKAAEELTSNQCFRITPEGLTVIEIKPVFYGGSSSLAKWLVASASLITIAGSIALTVFVPFSRPLTSAITGAAWEVFSQVVIDNAGVENIQWSKVAVAAVSAAALAWVCPLGASKIAGTVTSITKKEILGRIAGYAFLTCGNGVIGGATNAVIASIDGKDEDGIIDAFKTGATIAAVITVATIGVERIGGTAVRKWIEKKPNGWLAKASNSISSFIGKHQVHLKNQAIEDILNPKTVYQAAKAAANEFSSQMVAQGKAVAGGSYDTTHKYSVTGKYEAHEIPPFSSSGDAKRGRLPSVLMEKADHQMTAGWGSSRESREYCRKIAELWSSGNTKEAIDIGIQDIIDKFGHKYDEGIEQLLAYAIEMGWY